MKKQLKKQEPAIKTNGKKRQAVIVVLIVVGLFGSWTMLANSNALDPLFKQKGKKSGTVSTQSFNSNSPSKEYVYAGGRLVATEEPPGGGGCIAPSAPGTPTATALSTTSVSVSWPASSGTVDHYEVERRNGSGSYSPVATVAPASGTVSTTDNNGLNADTAYLYRIRAFSDQQGTCPSPYSNIDLATTVMFTSDPPVSSLSKIYAIHLLRLRTAVNAVQVAAGQSQFTWEDLSSPGTTEAPASGTRIRKEQVQKLRNRLNEARIALGLTPQPYTNEPLTQGVTVFANHVLQLHQGVQ